MSPEATVAIWLASSFWLLMAFSCVMIEASQRQHLRLRGMDVDAFSVMISLLIAWPIIMPLRLHNRARRYGIAYDDLKNSLNMERKQFDRRETRQLKDYANLNESYEELQDTLAAIEPYVNWREITEDLDGKTCETWADAIDDSHARSDRRDGVTNTDQAYSPTDRWWRPEELK